MSDTTKLVAALTTNAFIGATILILFALFRARKSCEWIYMPRYNPHRYVNPQQRNGWVRPPLLPDGFVAWIQRVIYLKDDVVYTTAGLDALMYTLFMHMCLKLFAFCTLLGVFILMPMYSELGHNVVVSSDGARTRPQGIDRLSLTSIETESNVLIMTYVTSVVLSAYACYLLKGMYLKWIAYRYRHLISNAQNGMGLSVLVQYLPEKLQDDVALATFYHHVFEDKFESSMIPRDFSRLLDLRQKIDDYSWKLELAETKWEDLQQKQKENPKKVAKRPMHRTKFLIGKKVDSITWYTEEIENLRVKIEQEMLKERKPLAQGFVSFNSAVAALSCEGIRAPSAVPYAMLHTFAPEPRDVYWPNLKLTHKQRALRTLLVSAATFWLVFFWVIPVTFVASLTTLSALSRRLPFLAPIVNANPVITGYLEGFLPGLALIIFNILLPKILLLFAKIEGIEADSWMQVSVFKRFSIFIFINNFLVITLAGAVFDQIDVLINDPTSVIELLGNSIPKAATFFTSFIMILGFVGIPLQLLNPGHLIVGTLMKKTLAKTEAQQDRVEAPKFINYGVDYGKHMLVVVLGFCYAPIAPIILPFALVYFALGFLTIKFKVLYCFVPTDEGGGAMWPELFSKIRVTMLVAHLTLAGILALKKNAYVTPLAVPLAIGCWFYTGTLMSAYNVRGKYLTAEMAMHLDNDTVEDLGGGQKHVAFAANETRLLLPAQYDLPGTDACAYADAGDSAVATPPCARVPTDSGENVYSAYLHNLVHPRDDAGNGSGGPYSKGESVAPVSVMCPHMTRGQLCGTDRRV
eukprot:m.1184672 g.1184672  ORF g.1184672 m.1184672 type:complete len:805 (+) comp24542_c0_seq2:135-2549(+)